jgi:hypothetical protein
MEKLTETEAYDVIVVMDPTRALERKQAIDSMEWMMLDIDANWHKEICQTEQLRRFAFDLNRGIYKCKVAGKKCILIHEMVSEIIVIH